MWRIIATWPFALQCVEKGGEILKRGGKALDAAEAGIHLVETDPTVDSVGRGGYLDENGDLALDGAVMDGDTLKTGAVACVRHYEHPVSLARAVMEKTKHNILVGPAAERFAAKMGFETVPDDYMITPKAREKYEREVGQIKTSGHDTIGCVALDETSSMAIGMSTSGANLRLPGRVGDTPIIGSGFYVETGVGGAAATGLGEDIMRTCLCFRAVDMMREGLSAQEAAEKAVLTATERIVKHGLKPNEIAIVCLDAQGHVGGACNHQGYSYAVAGDDIPAHVVNVAPVIDIKTL